MQLYTARANLYLRVYTFCGVSQKRGAFGEKVKASIHQFLPYRDEFIDFILYVSLYVDDPEIYKKIFQLFEDLLPYQDPPPSTGGFDHVGDNFRFILREMFLYLIAALIRNDKLQIADTFMSQGYFNASRLGGVEI